MARRFCGLTRNTSSVNKNNMLKSSTSNWTFRYDTKPGKWFPLVRHPETSAEEVPVPRFAHQAVYHAPTRRVFLHGGNAGNLDVPGPAPTTGAVSSGSGVVNPSLSGGDGSGNVSMRQSPSPPTVPGEGGVPPLAGAPTGQPAQETSEAPREQRLDDLWMMEMKRYVSYPLFPY